MEPWSFAIITDLHIGCFYHDYGRGGWELDGGMGEGQEYFLTERLRRVVDWINLERDPSRLNIKFVAVLGDLTDSGEGCEFLKAREILDRLGVPYVPLLGNHDIWPYTRYENSGAPLGAEYFVEVFLDRFESMGGSEVVAGWERDDRRVKGSPLMNYAFEVGGVHFLALDCVNRERLPGTDEGASPVGVFYPQTRQWMLEHLQAWGDDPVIILSHHPLSGYLHRPPGTKEELWNKLQLFAYISFLPECYPEIGSALRGHENILAVFAGHNHSCYETPLGQIIWNINKVKLFPVEGVEVVVTEALVAGSNQRGKGFIRIAKVKEDLSLDWGRVEGEIWPGLNPCFEIVDLGEEGFKFMPGRFTRREVELRWDFGDGRVGEWEPLTRECIEKGVVRNLASGDLPRRVVLAYREEGDEDFVEEISHEVGCEV